MESSSSCSRRYGDALLEDVHPPGQLVRPPLVAGGAVAAGQLVELLQEGTGVAGVAAHRAVGPAGAEAVEAQVELDQAGDVGDLVHRVAQGPQPGVGHPGPDHLVVVERHPARSDGAGLGLADVVEEGGQAQDLVGTGLLDHRDGVGQDVLVAVDGVLLEGEAGQLGQELVGQAGVDQEPQAVARVRRPP